MHSRFFVAGSCSRQSALQLDDVAPQLATHQTAALAHTVEAFAGVERQRRETCWPHIGADDAAGRVMAQEFRQKPTPDAPPQSIGL